MKKDLPLTIIVVVLVAVSVAFCLIVGPVVWVNSASHFSRYSDFQENGTKTTGTIQTKRKTDGFAHMPGDYYVDVILKTSNNEFESVDDLRVKTHAWSSLIYGEEVVIYFKNDGEETSDVLLARDYEKEYLGFMNNPIYGKWMTLGSCSGVLLFILWLIYIKRKNKPKPYVRPKDF